MYIRNYTFWKTSLSQMTNRH